jgi:hypothetical protein
MRNELYPEISEEKIMQFSIFLPVLGILTMKKMMKSFSIGKNVLKEGGIFILDFLNEGFVKNTLVSETKSIKEKLISKLKKELKIIMLLKTSIFQDKGQDFHYFEKVKLSTLEQIETLAASCGFESQKSGKL